MNKAISRYVQVDDWVFEVKMIRALKVDSYGQPYKAIAHFNLNGDFATLDGEMHSEQSEFSDQDYRKFFTLCQQLDVKKLLLDPQKHPKFASGEVVVTPQAVPLQKLG